MASKNGWVIGNGTVGITIPLKKSTESSSCSITSMNFRKQMTVGMILTGVTNVAITGMTFTQMRMANKYGDVWIARLIQRETMSERKKHGND